MGALEDWGLLSEGDKARARQFMLEAIDALERGRIGDCGFFDLTCRRARKALEKKKPDQGS